MTYEELMAETKRVCPHCADGNVPKKWLGEAQHSIIKGSAVSVTLCRANDLWQRFWKGYGNG
jgi:hypothetical protein